MANNDAVTNSTAGSDRCAQLEQEVSKLRAAINWVDGLTQEADSTIEAIAKAAQATLQAGADVVIVHRLLGTIVEVSAMHTNTVNCEAEAVDANYRADNDRSELAERLVARRWRVEMEVEA